MKKSKFRFNTKLGLTRALRGDIIKTVNQTEWRGVMKFKVEFKLKYPSLVYEYRKAFISFLKKCLSEANDGVYYEEEFGNPKRKDYAFTVQLPRASFQKEEIVLEGDRIKFILTTGDKKLGFILYAAMLEQKGRKFPLSNGNSMTVVNICMLPEQQVLGNDAVFKMLSPLVIREHKRENNSDYYYSCEHEDFESKATAIIKEQMRGKGYTDNILEGFSVEKINCKKTVVRHYGICIECTLGYIRVQGNNTLLNELLHNGCGSRKNECFGMVELVAE